MDIHDIFCSKVNVKEVSTKLQAKEGVSKSAKRSSRMAAKKNDPSIFFGVLRQFDFKSFVAFVEVVRDLSVEDDKHYQLFSMICSNFKHLREPSDPDSMESYSKLMTIIKLHEQKSSQVTISYTKDGDVGDPHTSEWTDVKSASITSNVRDLKLDGDPVLSLLDLRTIQHDSEDELLDFSQDEGDFYSHTHGVRVTVNRQALPNDSMHIFLTVNDYSKKIKIPEGYNASYSALISLRCRPEVDSFLEFISITIPHCACGDIEEELCVLSASEPGSTDEVVYLQEDSDIEIESIDDRYFTFRTKHFTKYKVGSNSKSSRKQKSSKKNPMKSGHSALTAKKSRSFERSSSCPDSEMEENIKSDTQVDNKFVAIRGIPYDIAISTTSSKFFFFVTLDASDTYIEVFNFLYEPLKKIVILCTNYACKPDYNSQTVSKVALNGRENM